MLGKFKEFNNPEMFKYFKMGFATLIVIACLLFAIGLAVSPTLRHEIGIGGATPVTQEERPHHHVHHPANPDHKVKVGVKGGDKRHQGQRHGQKPHRSGKSPIHAHAPSGSPSGIPPSKGGEQPSGKPPHPTHENESPDNGSPESAPSGEDNTGNGGETSTPTSPPPTHPTEPKPPVKVEVTPPKVEVKPPKIAVEVELPPITNAPVVEEVVGTVNETVNGVTGPVEETVNEVGGGLGVHVEVPEVCVINCH